MSESTEAASHPRRVTMKIRRLPHAQGLEAPAAASASSAGLDLRAAVAASETIQPGERRLIPTGFSIELPAGWEGQVRPRSGLAVRHGITMLNAPGTIDSDYRGEVQILAINHGEEPFEIRRGDRIAQLVVAAVAQVTVEEFGELSATTRGAGGFGSTGLD